MSNQLNHSAQDVRNQVFTTLSGIAHAMSAPARLRIIQILSNRPFSVEELSAWIGESTANTSQHLQKLKKAGLVMDSRLGLKRTYSLANASITDALLQFQKIAASTQLEIRVAEESLCPSELLAKLSLTEIVKDIRAEKAILIDVRDREDFEATPAPKALFFPRDGIKNNLDLLSKKKTIYAFCRGRYCNLANDVVRSLRKRGYRAYRLSEMSREIELLFKEEET